MPLGFPILLVLVHAVVHPPLLPTLEHDMIPTRRSAVETDNATRQFPNSARRKQVLAANTPPQKTVDAERQLANGLIWSESGFEPSVAALLKLVPHSQFDEHEFADRSKAIAAHHAQLSAKLGRPVGLAVAALDYFVNVSSELVAPTIVEREVLEMLERRSVTDPLTGLFNRLHFDNTLRREVARCVRHKSRLSLLLIDLDQFKALNDHSGHPAGDRMLVEVADAIQKSLRSSDVASRYGGDEFAVILPDTDAKAARSVAERIRASVSASRPETDGDNGGTSVTCSGGLAVLPMDATTATEAQLLAAADRALYRAKRRGGNCVAAAVAS